ncbi:MAG: SoxR reducing system RseC family protein [Dechloromonas sp.]|nr:SoxR reducing system RseC family protein [Dechloromonas sp.]
MNGMIEHRGIVHQVMNGRATIAMETSSCGSCGHGSHCSIGQLAEGRAATLITVPAPAGLQAGDAVRIGLPASKLTLSALLGYLFPALAMLLGAALGSSLQGSDGGTALGAIIGFLAALVIARLAISHLPGLMPAPQLLTTAPLAPTSQLSHQE